MNRLATLALAGILVSSFACKAAEGPPPAPAPPPPPPPQASQFPAGCNPVLGSTVDVSVDKVAKVPASEDCIVLDLDAVVEWQGDDNVKTLLVQWKPQGAGCDEPPKTNPACKEKSCSFDSSTVVSKVDLTFCYSIGVTDQSDKPATNDPRLIIRGRA